MHHRLPYNLSPSFSAIRATLLAALGFATAACGGTTTNGSGGGGGGTATTHCDNPQPINQADGSESGYVKCADGSIDRVKAVACTPVPKTDTCAGTEDNLGCTTAADCTGGPNGVCLHQETEPPGGPTSCGCHYQCSTDADCAADEACVCAGVKFTDTTFCTSKGDCLTDADCAGTECGLSSYTDGCGNAYQMYCRAASDACRVDEDCAANQNCSKTEGKGAWACSDVNCVIGRPLLVGDAQIFAPPASRADWADVDLTPQTDTLTPALREALAAHFTAMAAMEHASIGSFARASLELLALGAPPALLAATHEAAADEILHARLAYALASAYSGAPVGPGRLPIAGVAPSTDEAEIVRALVREACVGETVAAAEALALSTEVTDPILHKVYARVAADESRHAELGWRTLAFLLARTPALKPVAEAAFAEAMSSMSSAPLVVSDIESREHGLLSSAALATLRTKAIAEIVDPCRRAALAPCAEPQQPVSLS